MMMQGMLMHTHRRWFTLIELLVVIGIIAILAGLLLPTLAKAKEKAKQATCLNDVKQLCMGFMMYMEDANERFPSYTNGNGGAGTRGGWVYYDGFPVPSSGNFDVELGVLYEYVGNREVYHCPSDKTGSLCSYGVNSDTRGACLADIDNPTDTPLLLEEGTGAAKTTNDGFFDIDCSPRDYVVNRHGKGSIYGFCDGHVKWEKWDDAFVLFICDVLEPRSNF